MSERDKKNNEGQTSQHEQPPEETPKSTQADAQGKTARFAHLGQSSKVASAKNNKGLLGGLIAGVAVVAFIFIVMLSGGQAKKTKQNDNQQLAADNDEILLQNERRLAELAAQQRQAANISQPPLVAPVDNQPQPPDDSLLQARRNAPTQMYAAAPSPAINPNAKLAASLLAGQDLLSQFANAQNAHVDTVTATRIQHPDYTIAQGEFIHAALETAINSDLPGMVRAIVTEPVYAYVGAKPVIPAGSRLVGQYASLASNGAATERVFVIWNRVITPDGISVMINSPGSDALGRAGMGADARNVHFFQIFGTAALLSIMGAATANVGVSSYDQPNSADAYRTAITSSFQQAAESSLSQNKSIKPTLHIHQGDAVTVFVAHDLDLYAALGPTT